jgi:putative transposase
VPARRRKCQRLGVSTALADRLAAEHPNHDYQFDQTTDGRILKLLDVVDEHTRECLGGLVDRSSHPPTGSSTNWTAWSPSGAGHLCHPL